MISLKMEIVHSVTHDQFQGDQFQGNQFQGKNHLSVPQVSGKTPAGLRPGYAQ